MPTAVTWNGTAYSVPNAGELNWATLTNFLVDLGNNAQTTNFQKLGSRIAVSTPVTVLAATDSIINVDTTVIAAPVTVNLPAGAAGQVFYIVDGSSGAAANNITIDGNAAETINGSANYVIRVDNGGVCIGWDGTEWRIISDANTGYLSGPLRIGDGGSAASNTAEININQNAETGLDIRNASAGTASETRTVYHNVNGEVGSISAYGSGFTTSNSEIQDGFTVAAHRQALNLAAINNAAINFWNGTSQNMTLDNSGNLGIGTTSNDALRPFQVQRTSGSQYGRLESDSLTDGQETSWESIGTGNFVEIATRIGTHYNSSATTDAPCGFLLMQSSDSGANYFWTDDSNLLRTSPTGSNRGTTSGTVVGDQTSDLRLKTEIKPTSKGLAEILKLNPVDFKFKDRLDNPRIGFIAQEVEEVVPESPYRTGDTIDGVENVYAMDYEQLIPVLTKAIQELSARLEKLEG